MSECSLNVLSPEALKNHPKEGPVYMVNLVKYREKSLDGDGSGLLYTFEPADGLPWVDLGCRGVSKKTKYVTYQRPCH